MDTKFEDFVNVSVRIRPSPYEDTTSSCLQVINKQPPVLLVLDKSQTYHFDNIFTDTETQKHIYDETVKSLVQHVKNGYNCTVFAYGQTGTGKTYTMGTNPDILHEDDWGLMPRTLEDFFNHKHDEDTEIKLLVSFIEIYNEKVFDLLTDKKTPLPVKGFTVHGFEKIAVHSVHNALQLLQNGGKQRHTGETKQNSNSSRSHAIFTIYCITRDSERETIAKLNLVDLAGSESVRKTGNQGSSLHEGININKGLLSLGQVMTALSTNSTHVPYRQSIITTILQDSLNKKNFVSLIACVSPSSVDLGETLQTLEFSKRVKKLKNKPEVNNFIMQYKKENPSLFSVPRGLTPSKRPNSGVYETPFKKSRRSSRLCLPMIQEPANLITNSDFDSSKSMLSSTITSASDIQQNLSPVIKKYMDAMEQSLMNRLEDVIKNTLRKSRRSSLRNRNKENTMTPSVSLAQLAQVVRSEVQLQFSAQVARRATSSPLESILFENRNHDTEESTQIPRKVLTYDDYDLTPEKNEEPERNDDLIFKVPAPMSNTSANRRRSVRLQSKQDKEQTYDDCDMTPEKNEEPELNDDLIFKVPAPKINTSANNRRRSVRLQSKQDKQQVQMENRRRSVRLQLKQVNNSDSEALHDKTQTNRLEGTESCFCCQSVRTSKKRKREVPESLKTKCSPISAQTKRVLKILNSGSLKDIESLHTVGAKTAEKIRFFRQLKGSFKSIEDLLEMPYWTNKKHEKFLAENFLKVE